jgi:Protein O-mannosyl-transferase TMEM260-like
MVSQAPGSRIGPSSSVAQSVGPAVVRIVALLGPPILVGAIALLVIQSTLLPGVDFWDTGEWQAVGPLLGTAHPTGFPTYVILAWLASVIFGPLGEPAFRINLLSAVLVAATAAFTVDLARVLSRSTIIAMAVGLGLAFTEFVWAVATHADAHALHLLLVVILFRLLVAWEQTPSGSRRDRWLIAAAVVFGLSLGNHSLTLLLVPAVAAYVLAVDGEILRRRRFVAVCAAAVLGTFALLLLELPLRAGPFRAPLVYGHPETWDGFWYVVLAEQFRGSLVDPFGDLGGKLAGLVDRTVLAFGPLTPLIPVGLVATVRDRRPYALLTGLAVAITCFFAASYENADIGRYYLVPAFIAWTWLAILAADLARWIVRLAEPGPPRRPASKLGAVVALAFAVLIVAPTAKDLGLRAERVDRSQDVRAQQWLDRTLSAMEPDALIVSWWSTSTPLWYAQRVEGQRPDVAIIDDRTRLDQDMGDIYDVIDANLGRRPVYVIREDPREVAELDRRYVLEHLFGPDARTLTQVVSTRETAS